MSHIWLNNQFFEDLLKESSNDEQLKLINLNLEIATNKGDNYASVMYRAKITYEEFNKKLNKNVIVKVMPDGEISSKVMIKNKLYQRESLVYTQILEKAKKLLASIDDFTIFSPRCIKTGESPIPYLIFEDLKDSGFKMGDRKVGLNLEISKVVLIKIAKFHACSVVLQQEKPSIMNMYLNGSISSDPDRQDFLVFYKVTAKSLEACVKKWKGFEKISRKLEGFNERIIQRGIETYLRDDNAFNVLNHNDLWANNLMFKYSYGNQLRAISFLDYQLSYWGSPGIDLNFFLFGSVDDDVREEHFHYLIMKYHKTLARTLEDLCYDIKVPTIRDIHIEIVKTGFIGFLATVCLKPLAMVEDTSDANMDILLKDTPQGIAFREKIFENPKFQIILKKKLRYFDYMGYFDDLDDE